MSVRSKLCCAMAWFMCIATLWTNKGCLFTPLQVSCRARLYEVFQDTWNGLYYFHLFPQYFDTLVFRNPCHKMHNMSCIHAYTACCRFGIKVFAATFMKHWWLLPDSFHRRSRCTPWDQVKQNVMWWLWRPRKLMAFDRTCGTWPKPTERVLTLRKCMTVLIQAGIDEFVPLKGCVDAQRHSFASAAEHPQSHVAALHQSWIWHTVASIKNWGHLYICICMLK